MCDNRHLEVTFTSLRGNTNQASAANKHRGPDPRFNVGDRVLLSTFHRRRQYMQRGDTRVAKFMVRYDGPYRVLKAFPDTSSYTLDLPSSMNVFPTFHASLLRAYVDNDATRYPNREDTRPGPVVGPNGEDEWFVERILDRKRVGRGYRYLVRWQG